MTIAESIATERRRDEATRANLATDAEWMANLVRMFDFRR